MKIYRVVEIETISGKDYQIQEKVTGFFGTGWYDKEVNPNWPSPTHGSKEKMIAWCKSLNDAEEFGRKTKVIYGK